MPDEKTVFARWVHPAEHQLNDGTVLVPGETVVEIPERLLDTGQWEKVTKREADKAQAAEDGE